MNRPRARLRLPTAALGALLLAAIPAQAQVASDALRERLRPQGYVSDFADMLDAADRQALETRLAEVEKSRGAQIAVVTLASLEGGEINDFANKLYRQWGVGEKGKNNGVLLLVARDDRKARIEVGYGLEPILPDILAGRVLDDDLFPAFRQKKYSEGLKRTGLRIAEIVEKNEPAPKTLPKRPRKVDDWFGLIVAFLMMGGGGAMMAGAATRAKTAFGVLFGGLLAAVGLGILGVPLGWAGLIGALIVEAIAFALGYSSNPARPGGPGSPGRRYSSNDGWIWAAPNYGGGSGGGGFDWGGSSGGFGGFGGGDSGGGGASGGW
ncbi:MAG: TPM domain-containing protein [Isosphaeraceae bacterium]